MKYWSERFPNIQQTYSLLVNVISEEMEPSSWLFLFFLQPVSVTAMPACATPATGNASAPPKASKEIDATCEFHFLHFMSFYSLKPQYYYIIFSLYVYIFLSDRCSFEHPFCAVQCFFQEAEFVSVVNVTFVKVFIPTPWGFHKNNPYVLGVCYRY